MITEAESLEDTQAPPKAVCLDGMPHLDSIGTGLAIAMNDKLSDIEGLEGIRHISSLHLNRNPYLSDCSILPFCNFLDNNGPENYFIEDNKSGCNSDLEILAHCRLCPCALSDKNFWTGNGHDGFWQNEFNWSQQSIPDEGDDVQIETSDTPIILASNLTAQCYSLSISQGITFIQEQGSVLLVKCADQ